jgi:sugar O-acyltransferase (sialic acid O-acetyltransferase NeuD family)
MLPSRYVVLDSFPVLPTGKVDRKGLPNPFEAVESGAKSTPAPPPPSVEQEVVNLLKELLQLEDIAEDANFVKLGADSLLTAVLMHRIQQRFKVEILFDDLVEPPTPVNLARLIKAALDSGKGGPFREKPAPQSGEPITRRAATVPLFEPVRFTRPLAMAIEPGAADQRSSVKPNLIIIGAGQFGREIFTWAIQAIASGFHCRIKGFLDKRADALEGYDYVAKILGDVKTYKIEEGDVFVGSIGDPTVKHQCYSPIVERGGHFINIIHPLANIGNNVQLGTGVVMGPFASVTCDVKIGNHVTIGAFSNAGHDTLIGDWCQISSHCGINGAATLGEGVFLGSHACIIPKIKVGAWAFVGAGSVVVRDVPPGARVFGNPASPIGRVRRHG